ncbi:MAG TPA: NAD(P)-dependent oxidoreductase [Solirubrobacteraceae bacterium]|nr:NAD(P)-dependent oxidoreductase [Solirubrobacteraceae bacterium]
MSDSLPRIGVVGLGAMGSKIAVRLASAGYSVTGYDPNADAALLVAAKGCDVADSPRTVADVTEIVITSLPTPDALREAVVGETGVVRGNAVTGLIDLSTVGPPTAAEVAATLETAGIWCVDAPVSGAPAGAEAGTLTVMASGSAEAVEAARHVLEQIARTIHVVGDQPGMGQVVKVINNLMSAAAITITAEGVLLGVKAGLDPRTLLEVVGQSSGSNTAVVDKFPRQVLTRRFDHGFRLELMAKDVGLCMDEAKRQDMPMLVGAVVDQLWRLGVARSEPGDDCTTIVHMFEDWADTTIVETSE